ncbi:PREDICTED: glucan endo-1,3-beta-glucosidase-like [Fragaria vesca subsp. vesca]
MPLEMKYTLMLQKPSQYLLPVVQNIQNTVTAAYLQGQIKVSTAIDTTLLGPSFPSSNGAFSNAANSFITLIITFLGNNGALLRVNIHPYAYIGDPANIKLEYALFTSPGVVVQDGNGYPNIFNAILDTHYSVLEKAGAPNTAIVVSKSGWPSEGSDATNMF